MFSSTAAPFIEFNASSTPAMRLHAPIICEGNYQVITVVGAPGEYKSTTMNALVSVLGGKNVTPFAMRDRDSAKNGTSGVQIFAIPASDSRPYGLIFLDCEGLQHDTPIEEMFTVSNQRNVALLALAASVSNVIVHTSDQNLQSYAELYPLTKLLKTGMPPSAPASAPAFVQSFMFEDSDFVAKSWSETLTSFRALASQPRPTVVDTGVADVANTIRNRFFANAAVSVISSGSDVRAVREKACYPEMCSAPWVKVIRGLLADVRAQPVRYAELKAVARRVCDVMSREATPSARIAALYGLRVPPAVVAAPDAKATPAVAAVVAAPDAKAIPTVPTVVASEASLRTTALRIAAAEAVEKAAAAKAAAEKAMALAKERATAAANPAVAPAVAPAVVPVAAPVTTPVAPAVVPIGNIEPVVPVVPVAPVVPVKTQPSFTYETFTAIEKVNRELNEYVAEKAEAIVMLDNTEAIKAFISGVHTQFDELVRANGLADIEPYIQMKHAQIAKLDTLASQVNESVIAQIKKECDQVYAKYCTTENICRFIATNEHAMSRPFDTFAQSVVGPYTVYFDSEIQNVVERNPLYKLASTNLLDEIKLTEYQYKVGKTDLSKLDFSAEPVQSQYWAMRTKFIAEYIDQNDTRTDAEFEKIAKANPGCTFVSIPYKYDRHPIVELFVDKVFCGKWKYSTDRADRLFEVFFGNKFNVDEIKSRLFVKHPTLLNVTELVVTPESERIIDTLCRHVIEDSIVKKEPVVSQVPASPLVGMATAAPIGNVDADDA